MGWFLIGGKKEQTTKKGGKPSAEKSQKSKGAGRTAKSKTPPKNTTQTTTNPATSMMMALLKPAFILVLLFVLLAGWYFGKQFLVREVNEIRHVDDHPVNLVNTPPWMLPSWREEIRAQAQAPADGAPLNQAALQNIAANLQRNIWVKKVHSVQRSTDGSIQVSADYRQPVAVMHPAGSNEYILVDQDFVRLPVTYRLQDKPSLQKSGLPIIANVRSVPPQKGDVWDGEDLRDGLALAMILRNANVHDYVDRIDVHNHRGLIDDRAAHLQIFNTSGGRIDWGSAPGSDTAIGGVSVEEKINRVRAYLESTGTYDVSSDQVLVNQISPDQDPHSRNTNYRGQ